MCDHVKELYRIYLTETGEIYRCYWCEICKKTYYKKGA